MAAWRVRGAAAVGKGAETLLPVYHRLLGLRVMPATEEGLRVKQEEEE